MWSIYLFYTSADILFIHLRDLYTNLVDLSKFESPASQTFLDSDTYFLIFIVVVDLICYLLLLAILNGVESHTHTYHIRLCLISSWVNRPLNLLWSRMTTASVCVKQRLFFPVEAGVVEWLLHIVLEKSTFHWNKPLFTECNGISIKSNADIDSKSPLLSSVIRRFWRQVPCMMPTAYFAKIFGCSYRRWFALFSVTTSDNLIHTTAHIIWCVITPHVYDQNLRNSQSSSQSAFSFICSFPRNSLLNNLSSLHHNILLSFWFLHCSGLPATKLLDIVSYMR